MQILKKLNLLNGSIILFFVSLFLYINSVNNEYALDDELIVINNEQVMKGFGGLGDIFTSDIFASYYKANNAEQQLSGGRYRPLSVATFAIEYAFFENNPAPKHFVNVLLFALLSVLVFHTLYKAMRIDVLISFIIAFLFAIHPIHTEVVANIKSRDEILSLIFILLTIRYFLRYVDSGSKKDMGLTMLMFVLALLSKEYAVSLLVLLPLSAWLFRKQTIIVSAIKSWWLVLIFLVYGFIRYSIVGVNTVVNPDVLNDPYMYATGVQQIATKIFVAGKYLLLLFVPYPLSADYSFQQIPYKSLTDISVLAIFTLYVGIAAWLVYTLRKRDKMSFAILFFLINLALVGNFVFNIGATMGERLIFHSSLGFCMAIGFGIEMLRKKIADAQFQTAVVASLIVLLGLSSFVTIPRNADWKNTHTLFMRDVHTVPNSALANGNVAVTYVDIANKSTDKIVKDSLLYVSASYSRKALALHPRYNNAYINLGVAYFNLGLYDSAFIQWQQAYKLYPSNVTLHANAERMYNRGCDNGKAGDFQQAVYLIEYAVKLKPDAPNYWGDLGGAYLSLGRIDDAKYAWDNAIRLNPNEPQALKGLPIVNKLIAEKANAKFSNK